MQSSARAIFSLSSFEEKAIFIFFGFIFSFEISSLILKGCINILFSKLLWQISSIFVLLTLLFVFCFLFFALYFLYLNFLFSFIICFWLFHLVLFLRNFNEKHFFIIHHFSATIFEWLQMLISFYCERTEKYDIQKINLYCV